MLRAALVIGLAAAFTSAAALGLGLSGSAVAFGAVIAALVVLAMLPGFLGLLIVLPVLGHATWHLYRRALV